MQTTKPTPTSDLRGNNTQDPISDEMPSAIDLLQDPMLNQDTAFSEEERERFRLRGFLP